jgi:hypothetical protein
MVGFAVLAARIYGNPSSETGSESEVCVFGLDNATKEELEKTLSSIPSLAHMFDIYPWTPWTLLADLRTKFPRGRVLYGAADYQQYWVDSSRGPRCSEVLVGSSQAISASRVLTVMTEYADVRMTFVDASCRGACLEFRNRVCGDEATQAFPGTSVCSVTKDQMRQIALEGESQIRLSPAVDRFSGIAEHLIPSSPTSTLAITKSEDFLPLWLMQSHSAGVCFSGSDFRHILSCRPAVYPCMRLAHESGFVRQRLRPEGLDGCPFGLTDFLGYLGKNTFQVAVFQESHEAMLGIADELSALDAEFVIFVHTAAETAPTNAETLRILPILVAELDYHVLREGRFVKIWIDDSDGVHVYRRNTQPLAFPWQFDRVAKRVLDQELTKATGSTFFDDRLQMDTDR